MENIIIQIEQFLLKNAWGVIIAGVIASMLGTLLCYLLGKIYNWSLKKYNLQRKKERFINYTESFYRGAAASYSKFSSYRQILLVGDYIIDIFYLGIKIVTCLLVTCILIFVLKDVLWSLAIIAICSFVLYPQYTKLKKLIMSYKQTYNYIFGKDFTKKCIDGAIETLSNEKDNNEKDSE